MQMTENSTWFIKLCQENDIDFMQMFTNDVSKLSKKIFIDHCESKDNPLPYLTRWEDTSIGADKLIPFNDIVNEHSNKKYNRFW